MRIGVAKEIKSDEFAVTNGVGHLAELRELAGERGWWTGRRSRARRRRAAGRLLRQGVEGTARRRMGDDP